MPFTRFASSILQSNQDVVASDLTVDSQTVTVDTVNDRLGVNTAAPLGTIGVDGDLYFQPTAISTSHVYTAGSLDIRATDNIKLGTDGADSVRIGRTNTTAVKVHIRSGADTDLVVSNSMVGIGTDAPDHTLSVAGDIDLTGGLSFDGGTAVTSIDTDLSSVSGSDDTLASAKAIGAQLDTKSPTTGHSSIATVGTVASGTWEATDIAVAHGGTGASSASDARSNLGVAIGSDVQAHDADLDTLSGCQAGAATALAALTQTEVEILDGATLTTTELNYVDGVTSPIQTQLDAKGPVAGSGSIVTTGALNSGSITSGFGNIDIGSSTFDTTGAVGTGDLTVAGDVTATGGDLTLGTAADAGNATIKPANEAGDNVAGKNLTVFAGAGTGSGVPGKFEVKVAQPTGTAADVQTHNSAIVADGNGVSIYTGNSLAALANDTGFGEIIYWGTEDGTDSLAAGRLMSLNTSGVWKYADADAVATTNTLLAIALGSAVSDGLLVKGYFKLNSYIEGSFAKGAPCFVSEASGEIDFTAPSAAGDVLRIVGHGTSETNVILFDPSNDYVEL